MATTWSQRRCPQQLDEPRSWSCTSPEPGAMCDTVRSMTAPSAPTVAVRGESTREVDPEIAEFTVTVNARDKDRATTLSRLADRVAAVRTILDGYAAAIEKRETSRMSVYAETKRSGEKITAYVGNATTTRHRDRSRHARRDDAARRRHRADVGQRPVLVGAAGQPRLPGGPARRDRRRHHAREGVCGSARCPGDRPRRVDRRRDVGPGDGPMGARFAKAVVAAATASSPTSTSTRSVSRSTRRSRAGSGSATRPC